MNFSELFKQIENFPPADNKINIIDGGYMLHKIIWKKLYNNTLK